MVEFRGQKQLKNHNSATMRIEGALSFWEVKVIPVFDNILHCWNFPSGIGLPAT